MRFAATDYATKSAKLNAADVICRSLNADDLRLARDFLDWALEGQKTPDFDPAAAALSILMHGANRL